MYMSPARRTALRVTCDGPDKAPISPAPVHSKDSIGGSYYDERLAAGIMGMPDTSP